MSLSKILDISSIDDYLPEKTSFDFGSNSIQEDIKNTLENFEIPISPRNRYVAPIDYLLSPYLRRIYAKFGLDANFYKKPLHCLLKTYLKKPHRHVIDVQGIGFMFIHQSRGVDYCGDRRLRPDIYIEIMRDLLKSLSDNVRFFETYYASQTTLAVEYIDKPISFGSFINNLCEDSEKEYYLQIFSRIQSEIKEYFNAMYDNVGGYEYLYDINYNIIIDCSLDNILITQEEEISFILMDVFYLNEK